MGRKKRAGYIFQTFKGDHPPYHVHIIRGDREIGRWDIENQKQMDSFEISDVLRNALIDLGYMLGGKR